MGPVPIRTLLALVDEESAPMEDGEGGEDESMEEGPRKGGDPRSGRARTTSLEPGGAGAHEDSNPLLLLVRSLRQRKREKLSPQVRRRKERTK